MSRRPISTLIAREELAQTRGVPNARMWSESPVNQHWSRVGAAGEEPSQVVVPTFRASHGLGGPDGPIGFVALNNYLDGPEYDALVAMAGTSVSLTVTEPAGGWPDNDTFQVHYVVGGVIVNTFTVSSSSPTTGSHTFPSEWNPYGAEAVTYWFVFDSGTSERSDLWTNAYDVSTSGYSEAGTVQ